MVIGKMRWVLEDIKEEKKIKERIKKRNIVFKFNKTIKVKA